MKQNKQTIGGLKARFRPWDILYFVIWFGVLSGLAENALPLMRHLVEGKVVYLRSHTIWMSPLANVVVLSAAGLATLPFLMRLSRPMAVRITFVMLASIVFVNVLVIESLGFLRIHYTGKVILAIGLAIALQRLIARWALGFERFMRSTTIGLLLLVLVLTFIVGGRRYFQERRIITSLPESPPSAPNILLIVLDTVRAESMSLYGYERLTTPYLMDMAKGGTVFEYAIATSSWTMPTHVSLFTGRFEYETRTGWDNPLDTTYPTLAEVLTSQGYVTGGFVANTAVCSVKSGLARGFIHYEDYVASVRELVRSSSLIRYVFGKGRVRRALGYYELLDRKPAPRITNDFLRWIDRVPSGRPFFAFLNYFDAHQPYLPPADFKNKFGPTDLLGIYLQRYNYTRGCSLSNTTTEEIKSIRNAYDSSIAYLDYNMKLLFSELRQRGLLNRTLVVLVSDHGEEFGEHDTFGHSNDLQIPSIRVPLILRLPGIVPDDVTVQESITLRDIPATVIDLLGLPNNGLFPGQSLAKYWLEPGRENTESLEPILSELTHAPWRGKWIPVSKGDMQSLVIGDIHYIRNGDGTEEVYNLSHDPGEHNNLIETPQGVEVAAQVRLVLEGILH